MKKWLAVVLMTVLLAGMAFPALAIDMDRFEDAPGHVQSSEKTIVFGADVLDGKADSDGRMVMVYTDMGTSYYEYPFMLFGFCVNAEGVQDLCVTTDTKIYTVHANETNALSSLGISELEGCASVVLDAVTAEMVRDMLSSRNVSVTVGDGIDFVITDEYRAELELILAEWDEEIASVVSGTTASAYEIVMDSVRSDVTVTKLDGSEIGYETLEKGVRGDAVIELQKYLISLGYLTGAADGDYGSKTVEAVIEFQKDAGLEQTGIADSATQEAIYNNEIALIPDIVISSVKLVPNPGRIPELYIRLRNDSDIAVDRVDMRVICYDAYGERIYAYGYYDHMDFFYDREVEPNMLSRGDWYWDLYGFAGTKSVDIAICKYHTNGGLTVELADDELTWQHFEAVEEKEEEIGKAGKK